jgi:hypothetical protein
MLPTTIAPFLGALNFHTSATNGGPNGFVTASLEHETLKFNSILFVHG